MKIVTLATKFVYTKEQLEKLQRVGEVINYDVRKLKGDEIVHHIDDAEILIAGGSGVSEITAEVLQKCPRLKYISLLSSGTDYVDLAAASKSGIKVSNLRGANSQSVAEHIWGLIFSLSKRITESHIGTKEGKYEFSHYEGVEVYGKTIGIVGLGEIGSRVAKVALSLDMNILAFNRSRKDIAGVTQVDLNTLLKESDIVVVSIPMTGDTINLIHKEKINLMKDKSILVSVSREAIINKEDLLGALEKGKFFGVGLELEINTPADERFYKYPNVILTPHNAFFTAESERKANDQAVDNVVKFVEGKPVNLVTR